MSEWEIPIAQSQTAGQSRASMTHNAAQPIARPPLRPQNRGVIQSLALKTKQVHDVELTEFAGLLPSSG